MAEADATSNPIVTDEARLLIEVPQLFLVACREYSVTVQ